MVGLNLHQCSLIQISNSHSHWACPDQSCWWTPCRPGRGHCCSSHQTSWAHTCRQNVRYSEGIKDRESAGIHTVNTHNCQPIHALISDSTMPHRLPTHSPHPICKYKTSTVNSQWWLTALGWLSQPNHNANLSLHNITIAWSHSSNSPWFPPISITDVNLPDYLLKRAGEVAARSLSPSDDGFMVNTTCRLRITCNQPIILSCIHIYFMLNWISPLWHFHVKIFQP